MLPGSFEVLEVPSMVVPLKTLFQVNAIRSTGVTFVGLRLTQEAADATVERLQNEYRLAESGSQETEMDLALNRIFN